MNSDAGGSCFTVRFCCTVSPQASIRDCPPLLHGVLVSLGQVKHLTAIAWFSLTAGAYSSNTPDYVGIDCTLSTLTDSNLIPIVKELSLLYASSVTTSRRGTPYISGLNAGVLRRFLDKYLTFPGDCTFVAVGYLGTILQSDPVSIRCTPHQPLLSESY